MAFFKAPKSPNENVYSCSKCYIILNIRVGPFFKVYFAHLLSWRSHFVDSHGMFLFAYNLQEPSGIFTFMIFSIQIGKIKVWIV